MSISIVTIVYIYIYHSPSSSTEGEIDLGVEEHVDQISWAGVKC